VIAAYVDLIAACLAAACVLDGLLFFARRK